VNTQAGAHLTSGAVLDALLKRGVRREELAKGGVGTANILRLDYKESAADIRRLVSLAPQRTIQRSMLYSSRSYRRMRQKSLVRDGNRIPSYKVRIGLLLT